MASLQIQREQASNEVTLKLEGTLDAAAALMLRQALDEVTAPSLVIDFTRVREFQDLAVAVLSPAINAAGRDVRIAGVGTHHARMFRYFGVKVADELRGYYRADELLSA